MRRETAMDLLTARSARIREMGATALYLFGSTARDEAADGSDVDLFIDYDEAGSFSLIELVRLETYLAEDVLHTPVDLMTRTSLHPALRTDIEKTALRVF